MEGQLAAPFHFAVEFLILAVFAGAMFDAARAARQGNGRIAYVQAAGFFSLIVAQVLHGTLLLTGDGALPLVILRGIGFGLIAASLRPMPMAAATLPAVFVAGGDAGWAAVPAAFAVIAAARAFQLRKSFPAGGGPALASAFAAFAGGEIALAAAHPSGGVALAISHGLRALGAVFLARWLWLSLVRSIRLRFVAVFVAALVLLASVVAGALTTVIGHNLQQEEFNRLGIASTAQRAALALREQQALEFANLLGTTRTVADGLKGAPGSASLTDVAKSSVNLLPADLDFVAFFDAHGKLLASATDVPNAYPPLSAIEAIALSGSDSIQRVLRRRGTAQELTSSGDAAIAAIGASSIVDQTANSKVIGAVVVGYNLDRQLLATLTAGASADITLLKGGAIVSTTYTSNVAAAGLISGRLADTVRRVVEEEGHNFTAIPKVGDDQVFTVYSPLTNEAGEVVGVMALSRPAGLLAASQRSINRVLFLVTLGASAIAAALAWLLSGRVTKPIRALTQAARRVRSGDLHARATVEVPDEVGTLGEAFNDMADSLIRMTGDLREAADEEANLRVRVEAIMQSIGDALVATDGSGVVVAVNRAAESMLGAPADAIVGRHLAESLRGNDAEGRALSDLALAGNGATYQATVAPPGARSIPVALSGSPLRDASGAITGRVVLIRDVTREHEAERMKSEFLSNVSHELRTPLTPIKGYTEILRRKKFPRDKTEAFLDGIAESTKRLERIVEILVDFAALEAGRLKPRVHPIDVRTFTAEIAQRWSEKSDRHKIVRKVPADVPALLGDERLVRKTLDELMDNAIKFSPEGGTIELSAEAVAALGRRRGITGVRLTVRDSGIGIDPNEIGRLFQDFRQLDGSETRSYGGLGLGLSYARRVALANNGDLTVTSVPGKGSAFMLVLPAAAPLQAAKPKTETPTSTRIRRPVSPPRTASGRKKVAAARTAARKGSSAKPKRAAPKRPASKRAAPKRPAPAARATKPSKRSRRKSR